MYVGMYFFDKKVYRKLGKVFLTEVQRHAGSSKLFKVKARATNL